MMEFFHPHTRVTVNDLSEYFEEVSGGGTILYQPFISDKGEDNVLSMETSLNEVIAKYGKPNFKRHGQAYYNLIEWIKDGGRVLAHRIMPNDATYSHMILNVKTAKAYVPMYERRANSMKYLTDANGFRVQWKLDENGHTEEPIEVEPTEVPDYLAASVAPAVKSELVSNEFDSYALGPQGTPQVTFIRNDSNLLNPLIKFDEDGVFSENAPKVGYRVKFRVFTTYIDPEVPSEAYPNESPNDVQYTDDNVFDLINVDENSGLNLDFDKLLTIPTVANSFNSGTGTFTTPLIVALKVAYLTGSEDSPVVSDFSNDLGFVFKDNVSYSKTEDVVEEKHREPEILEPEFDAETGMRPVKIDGKMYYADEAGLVYTDGIKVKHEIQFTNVDDDSDFSADALLSLTNLANKNAQSDPDWDGYKNHFLLGIRSKGRGVFGDLLSASIKLNKLYNDTYNFRVYDLSIYEFDTEYGVTNLLEGSFEFSFYPDALTTANSPLSAQYVMDNAFNRVYGTFAEEVYDMLIDDIMDATENSNANDESWDDTSSIDFLFGQSKSGYGLYEKLEIDDDSVTLDASDGIRFQGGSLGAFSTENTHIIVDDNGMPVEDDNGEYVVEQNSEAYVRDKKISLYKEAYQGITIPEVMDYHFNKIDVVMDFNADLMVKKAILDFCNERKYHTFGYIDTGILYSPKQTVEWRENSFQYTDWCISIYGQNWLVTDEYSGKDINVTTTHVLAGKIPSHDRSYGVYKPIAGPKYGLVEGYKLSKATSWFPNEYEKEDLYTNRINYIERMPDQIRLMSQCTAQRRLTQLTEQNNVRTLFRMVNSTEEVLDNFYFEHATVDTLSIINATLQSSLNSYKDVGACDEVVATVSQTDEQRERKICQVVIGVKFTPVIERFDCIFEVRK